MYASGKGLPRDDVTAYMWFSLSASAGNADALQQGEVVASRMTPSQMIAAQKLVRDWEPKSNF
jgi:TPR repeat protein